MSQSDLFGAGFPGDIEPFFSLPELREMFGCADIFKWRFDPLTRELTISDIDVGSDRPREGLSGAVSVALDQFGNRSLLTAAIEAASKRNGTCRLDWPLISADGETHWIRFFASQEAGLGGHRMDLRGVAFSIDAGKRTEGVSSGLQDQLDAVVRVLAEAIIIIDAGCRIHSLNAPAERLLRCPATEVVGRSFTHFVPFCADVLNRLLARAVDGIATFDSRPSGIVRIVRSNGSSAQTRVSVAVAGRSPRMMFVLALADAAEDAEENAFFQESHRRGHRPAPALMTEIAPPIAAEVDQTECQFDVDEQGELGLASEGDAVTCAQALIRAAADRIRKAAQLLQSSAEPPAAKDPHPVPVSKPDPVADRFRRLVAQLTPRERQVLRQVVSGRTNKEIGRDLAISPRTVEAYRAKIMVKTMCQSVPALICGAVRAGVV